MVIDIAEIGSPIGAITLAMRDERLCVLAFAEAWPRKRRALERRFGDVRFRATAQVHEPLLRVRDYFAGDLAALTPIAVDTGGTPFQQAVWTALRTIPPGRTVAYRDLAQAIGHPAAVRAVGAANGANPVGIVIPCHRVIGADGRLVGYGGGVERKRWLLTHEAASHGPQRELSLPNM